MIFLQLNLDAFYTFSIFTLMLLGCHANLSLGEKKECMLFVLGRTRVGKGEFITQAVELYTGKKIDIVSHRLSSHTSKNSFHSLGFLTLVDTVGYDDTFDNDVAHFLDLLAETKKSAFYPPLVVIQTLGKTDTVWIEKLIHIFPNLVFGIRGSKRTFKWSKEELSKFYPLKTFHLPEFLSDDEDDLTSKKKYIAAVEKIIEFYKTRNPTREDIKFDSKIFSGTIEEVNVRKESKTERRESREYVDKTRIIQRKKRNIKTVRKGGHFEETTVRRNDGERFVSGLLTFPLLGIAGWATTTSESVWVDDYVTLEFDEWEDVKHTDVYCRYTLWEDIYTRNSLEEWKKLINGYSIFVRHVTGEWKKDKSMIVNTYETECDEHHVSFASDSVCVEGNPHCT